jgi:DNA-binding NarL/FixJ family response regulator
MSIRVLIADDHPLFRLGIAALLERDADGDIVAVGEVAGGDTLLGTIDSLMPDVVLLDVLMPGFDALEIVPQILSHPHEPQVLVLTAYDENSYATSLIGAGISGYVLKSEAPELIIQAIRAVARGETWFSQRIAGRVIRSVRASEVETMQEPDRTSLTPREHGILQLVAHGKTNSEIADELAISKATVQNYVSSIYAKLQIETRSQAVLYALRSNLVDINEVISYSGEQKD